MNERIRELAHEAGLPTYNPEGVPTKLEKFAQLIVRECINEVKGLQVSDWNQNWNQAIAHTVLHLKEHFGVEE